jgi:hypothetical protein
MRDLRCKQCQLEDNTGLCDRSDCINYSPACNIKVAEARADERAKVVELIQKTLDAPQTDWVEPVGYWTGYRQALKNLLKKLERNA